MISVPILHVRNFRNVQSALWRDGSSKCIHGILYVACVVCIMYGALVCMFTSRVLRATYYMYYYNYLCFLLISRDGVLSRKGVLSRRGVLQKMSSLAYLRRGTVVPLF